MAEKWIGLPLLLNIVFAGLSSSINCPNSQHMYDTCSVCMSIESVAKPFASANNYCKSGGGNLALVPDIPHFNRMKRYLESLKKTGKFWIGYKYHGDGLRITADGGVASFVIRNNSNFITGQTRDSPQQCIGIENGKFFDEDCSTRLPFLCQYDYSRKVTAIEVSPNTGNIYYAMASNNLVFRARIPKTGISEIIWRFNNFSVESGIRTSPIGGTQTQETSLEIQNFSYADHLGDYTLLVTNPAGTMTVSKWRVLQPVIGTPDTPARNITAAPGGIVGFECYSPDTAPLPVVLWFRNYSRIRSGGNVFISPITYNLIIRNLTEDDGGIIHCKIRNLAGEKRFNRGFLIISENRDRGLLISLRNRTLVEGSPYGFECVGGLYNNLIMIHHSATKVITYVRWDPRVNTGFPTASFDSVARTDAGRYICIINELPEFDVTARSDAYLNVYAPDLDIRVWIEQNGVTTTSDNIDSFTYDSDGSNLTIHCQFDASSNPRVEWHRNGEIITEGVSNQDNVSILRIEDFDNISTIYQCHVDNRYVYVYATMVLCKQLKVVTINPVSFCAEPNSNNSIYVHWNETSHTANPLLLRYDIKVYGPLHSNGSITIVDHTLLLSDKREKVISGLRSNALYEIVMTASSDDIESTKTEMTVKTYPSVPNETVSGIVVGSSSDNTILVVQWMTFMLSSDQTFPVTSYVIEYRSIHEMENVFTETVEGTKTMAIIEDLTDARSYQARMRVKFRSQRQPINFSFGPWSEYIPVSRVIDPYPSEKLNILILVFVILGVVILIAGVAIAVLGFGYCWYKKRPTGIYSIADVDQKTDGLNRTILPPDESHMYSTQNVPQNGTTTSIVDTTKVKGKKNIQVEACWDEEFGHLESLISTLNETVDSMAAETTFSGSTVINNAHTAVEDYHVVKVTTSYEDVIINNKNAQDMEINDKDSFHGEKVDSVVEKEDDISHDSHPIVVKDSVDASDGSHPVLVKDSVDMSDGPHPVLVERDDALHPALTKDSFDGSCPTLVKDISQPSLAKDITSSHPVLVKDIVDMSDSPHPVIVERDDALHGTHPALTKDSFDGSRPTLVKDISYDSQPSLAKDISTSLHPFLVREKDETPRASCPNVYMSDGSRPILVDMSHPMANSDNRMLSQETTSKTNSETSLNFNADNPLNDTELLDVTFRELIEFGDQKDLIKKSTWS